MGRGSRRKMEIWLETTTMKLTTKMIKDLIREEIEEANKERPSVKDIAKKLGAPVKEEQVTNEGIEHLADLTPEQIEVLLNGFKNLIQIAGSATGLTIAMTKVAEEIGKMKKGKEEGK